ncbi:MAG: hypothetical protein IPH69_13505 [Bacteroidales bacterium]|nr:hypothetical protein [Bacteroidales bacterium]
MRQKNRYLTFALIMLLTPSALIGQKEHDYHYYDSVTYSLYLSGKWNELIGLGNEAISKGIDYKYLRQRVGYARFASGDYYKSRSDFEKALAFDSYDQFTLEYLYYSNLYTGREKYSGTIEKRLSSEFMEALGIKTSSAIESIEMEYNFKFAGTSYRSHPQYYRVGVGSKISPRLSLFQSFSKYTQQAELQLSGTDETIYVRQLEYYSLLNILISRKLIVRGGYHYLHNSSVSSALNGNLFMVSLAPDLNRISLELSGSALRMASESIFQAGLQAGYVFPGKSGFYLTSNVSGLFQAQSNNLIFSQKAGFRMLKKVWLEGNASFGRMLNYNEFNGLYVYNSIDPLTMKTGISGYIPVGKRISLWANYSWERKEFYENSSFHYNQFSYLGGIRWKL